MGLSNVGVHVRSPAKRQGDALKSGPGSGSVLGGSRVEKTTPSQGSFHRRRALAAAAAGRSNIGHRAGGGAGVALPAGLSELVGRPQQSPNPPVASSATDNSTGVEPTMTPSVSTAVAPGSPGPQPQASVDGNNIAQAPAQPARWEHFDDIIAYAPHGSHEQAHIDFLVKYRKPLVGQWAVLARKKGPDVDPDHPDLLDCLIRLKSFIKYLQTVDMTPQIYRQIASLHGLINDPINRYPKFIISHYNTLYNGWQESNFGADNIDDGGDSQDESQPTAVPTTKPQPNSNLAQYTVRFPRDEDPVWGLKGIMHGILRTSTPRVSYSLDPRFVHEKRRCQVFGHNGLEPGDWWPLQRVALYRGAHGSSMGGISGRAGEGAYSIVVGSSRYEDLDEDEGETIWYSGSHSHENKDPVEFDDSSATKLLLHSLERSDRPVRVLRKKSDKAWGPRYGIRYDGLYKVTDWKRAKNGLGGVYRKFRLKRLPVDPNRPDWNPCTLEEARDKVSTARQAEIWSAVEQGYVPREA